MAGLQAIATARRLGAVVRAYDVRAAAKEEVQSLGAKFVELDLETQEGAGGYAKEQTAEYWPGSRSCWPPRWPLRRGHHHGPDPRPQGPGPGHHGHGGGNVEGAVIVDMAADSGGNCEVSVAGEDVLYTG